MNNHDDSTTAEKLTVCGTAFAFSCLAFVAAVLILLPAVASLCQAVHAPNWLTQLLVLLTIFGTPIVAAIWGISVGAKWVITAR